MLLQSSPRPRSLRVHKRVQRLRIVVLMASLGLLASIAPSGQSDEVDVTVAKPVPSNPANAAPDESTPSRSTLEPGDSNPSLAPGDPMLDYLKTRIATDPTHADSWRLMGRLEHKRGDISAAIAAIQHSLDLDPHSAASHFDLGQLKEAVGDDQSASAHFQTVVSLAPDSQYAETLYTSGRAIRQTSLAEMGTSDDTIEQVRYEIQTFDGSDDVATRFNELESDADLELKSLRFFLETGLLYNTNVTLTPISRELTNSDAASFQFFASPDLEWIAFRHGMWRSGTLSRSFFTVNDSDLSVFNLASFQPGAFIERDFNWNGSDLIGRVEYLYSLDLLDGQRFGDRHSITASMIAIRPDLDVIYSYIRVGLSQFNDDGTDPNITSLDGDSLTAGVSRFFQTNMDWMPTYSLGADLESTDTEGADYRYRAVGVFTDMTFKMSQRWSFVPSAGTGYRDYYDFTGPINRNELTYRIHGKLKFQMTQQIALAGIAGHDRFVSDNDDFDAQRTQSGLITTIVY